MINPYPAWTAICQSDNSSQYSLSTTIVVDYFPMALRCKTAIDKRQGEPVWISQYSVVFFPSDSNQPATLTQTAAVHDLKTFKEVMRWFAMGEKTGENQGKEQNVRRVSFGVGKRPPVSAWT